MTIERIRESVLGEVRAEADAIVREAEEKAKRQIEAAERAEEQKNREHRAEVKSEAAAELRRRLGRLQVQLRLEQLRLKNKCVQTVFDRALETVVNLAPGDYLSLMERWLQETGEEGGEVVVNDRDREAFERLLQKVNAALPDDRRFRLAGEAAAMKGGFLLRRKGFEVDMRLDSRFATLREEVLSEVAKVLFTLPEQAQEENGQPRST